MASRDLMMKSMADKYIQRCHGFIRPVHWHYTLKMEVDGVVGQFFRITNYHRYGNFVANYTDEITMEGYVDPKFFYDTLMNKPDNINCTLIARQYEESGRYAISSGETVVRRYRGLIINAPEMGLGNMSDNMNALNNPNQALVFMRIQLIDRKLLDLKMATFSCMYNSTKPYEALYMTLSSAADNYGIAGINRFKEPDVQNNRMMVIPQGTLVKDLAHYIQKNYGIFNHGIGCYVSMWNEEYWWYVYPVFNNKRYDKEYYKLSIMVVDEHFNHFEGGNTKRTWFVQQGETCIYTTTKITVNKDRYAELNRDTGVQFINQDELVEKTRDDVGTNKVYKDGKNALSSINMLNDRKDGLQNIKRVYEDTTNTAHLNSQVVGNGGQYVQIQWKYAEPENLMPGMPVKITYLGKDGVKNLYGTLHEYHSSAGYEMNQTIETAATCHVVMNIFIDNPEKA